jgi:uncharacterized repeat protein (TIGR02543 family)
MDANQKGGRIMGKRLFKIKELKRALVMFTATALIFTSVPINAEAAGTTSANYFSLEEVKESGVNEAVTNTQEAETKETAASTQETKTEETKTEESKAAETKASEAETSTQETKSETADAADIDTEDAGITGNTTLVVGSWYTMTGTKSTVDGTSDSWASDNTSVATVNGSTNNIVTVTGVGVGTATITHTYFKTVGQTSKTKTESIKVNVYGVTNHYMLSEDSSNIILYITTGDDDNFTELGKGSTFDTESADIYYYVRVKKGYAAETKFQHIYEKNAPLREEFPNDWNQEKTSIYDSIDSPSYGVKPGYYDALDLGCTYMGQYTNKVGTMGNVWVQLRIKANPIVVKVAYDANEGTGAPTDNASYYHPNVTEYNNYVITVPSTVPTREGYTFKGWLGSDGVIYNAGATVRIMDIWDDIVVDDTSGTFTFTAVWEDKVAMGSVSYHSNGSTGGTAVRDDAVYETGSKVKIKENTWLKYNYDFIGWNTEEDGTGTMYQPGSTIEMTEGTTHLYAQWKVKESVTLTDLYVPIISRTYTYDGMEKTWRISDEDKMAGFATDENGKKVNYIVTGLSATVKGTDVGEYELTATGTPIVTDTQGNDVTYKFNVIVQPGTLTITKRNVTITSESDNAAYTGKALTKKSVIISGDGFVEGEEPVITYTGSQTIVGTSQNTFTYDAPNTYSMELYEKNYSITSKYGYLTVYDSDKTQFEINISPAIGDDVIYNGEAQTVEGIAVNGDPLTPDAQGRYPFIYKGVEYFLEGFSASVTATDAGTYIVEVVRSENAAIRDAAGNDVTDQFLIKTNSDTWTIKKRNVTLTSASRSEQYSGQVLTAPTVEVSGDGFVSGEGASYVFADTSKVSTPNTTVKNEFTYTFNGNTNADNYNITKAEGTLTLTGWNSAYELLVEANSGTFTYDGEEHTIGGFKTPDTFRIGNAVYTVSGLSVESVTAKDYKEGGYSVNITGVAVVTDENGNDVTGLFDVKTKSGTLTINKRPITLTSASANKVYDGTALKAEEVTDSLNISGRTDEPGFVGGDGAAYTFTGTRSLVGTSENTFTYALNDGTKESNYIITVKYGTLNVGRSDSKYTITLQPVSGEAIYNGKEQSVEGFENTFFEFDGETYEVTGIKAVAKGTEPGVYESTYIGTPIILDSQGNDVTSMFNIDTTATGTLTIKGIYTLTINYIDTAGTTVSSPYVGNFVEGTPFGPIESPIIEGYTPNYSSVTGPEEGMPKRNLTVNVVYTAIVSQTTTVTPVTEPVATPVLTPTVTTPAAEEAEEETPVVNPQTQAETPAPAAPSQTATPQVTPAAAPIAAIPVEADIAEAIETVAINDEETPRGVIVLDENGNAEIVEIDDEATALAAGLGAAWALINLIATILSAVICIVLLVTWFIRKKKDENEDNDSEEENKDKEDEEEDDEEKKTKRRTICRILSIIPAVASVIIFCLTENIKNPMILVDKWTVLMIVLLIVNIILAFFSKKKKKDEDDDEEEDKKEQ